MLSLSKLYWSMSKQQLKFKNTKNKNKTDIFKRNAGTSNSVNTLTSGYRGSHRCHFSHKEEKTNACYPVLTDKKYYGRPLPKKICFLEHGETVTGPTAVQTYV